MRSLAWKTSWQDPQIRRHNMSPTARIIGVLFGCFGRKIDLVYLVVESSTRETHLFPLEGYLWQESFELRGSYSAGPPKLPPSQAAAQLYARRPSVEHKAAWPRGQVALALAEFCNCLTLWCIFAWLLGL